MPLKRLCLLLTVLVCCTTTEAQLEDAIVPEAEMVGTDCGEAPHNLFCRRLSYTVSPSSRMGSVSLGASEVHGYMAFHTEVAFPTSNGTVTQQMLLDSGSSTVALCDAELASTITASKQDSVSCNVYGNITGPNPAGYNGYFYKGSMSVSGQSMSGPFAVMRYQEQMPCSDGYQGIFGIAYKGIDKHYKSDASYASTSSFSSSQNWCNRSEGNSDQSGVFVDPLMSALESLSAAQGDRIWGLYWNGQVGADTGNLYVGGGAKTNTHYKSGTPMVAQMYNAHRKCTACTPTDWAAYNVKITQFTVGSTQTLVTGNEGYTQGVIDTGTPFIQVPSSIYSALQSDPSSPLQIELVGQNGHPVILNLGTGSELMKRGYVSDAVIAPGLFIIGFPLWNSYYTVINVDDKEMSFLQHTPQSLEMSSPSRVWTI